ncbi:MAG TPA: hypothetical protein EYP85_06180, partial [Armatimonadetes bacterium]|nr:hypothetical protein [Armatimonadota bacterium]
ATDPDGDALTITILYSPDGGNTWETMATDQENDGRYTWDTQAAGEGSEYLIKVQASDGTYIGEDISDATFRIVILLVKSFGRGLHFLAFPAIPLDPDPAKALQGLTGTLKFARYNPDLLDYVKYSDNPSHPLLQVQPGAGYWCYLESEATLTLQGTTTPNQPFDIPVFNGWTMAGNPFNAKLTWSLADLQVVQKGQVVGSLGSPEGRSKMEPYGWAWVNGQYVLVFDRSKFGFEKVKGELNEWEGVWLKGKAEGVALRVAPSTKKREPAGPPSPPTAEAWAVHLSVFAADAADTENVFGIATEPLAIENPPARVGGQRGVDLSFVHPGGGPWLAGDLRCPSGRQTWHAVVTCTPADSEVTLTWPELGRQLPRDHQLWLMDEATGQRVLMNARSRYTFRAGPQGATQRAFTIELQRRAKCPVQIVNVVSGPVRGRGVRLTVTLTGEAEVTGTVINLRGQLVRGLPVVHGRSGNVILTWDGTDRQGRPVPSGLYLVRLLARGATGETAQAVRTVRLP